MAANLGNIRQKFMATSQINVIILFFICVWRHLLRTSIKLRHHSSNFSNHNLCPNCLCPWHVPAVMPQLSESAPRASISVQVKQGFWEAHLPYADDAQLYIGLKNCNCSASIDCLEAYTLCLWLCPNGLSQPRQIRIVGTYQPLRTFPAIPPSKILGTESYSLIIL